MSSRNKWEAYDYWYSSDKLFVTVESADIIVSVSGLPVSIQTLAQAGWTCRIRHNAYGGRTRITFHGPDGKSTILFRLDSGYRQITALEIFELLTKDQGVGTFIPKVIPSGATDQQLLDQVDRNIKRRLKARPRTRPAATVIERAMKFAAA